MAFGLKIAFVNLGCRVNRVELDAIAQVLEDAGYKVVDEDEAEIIVINTCAVTGGREKRVLLTKSGPHVFLDRKSVV